jgi:maltooligosyltrehalose trehalohydrolase
LENHDQVANTLKGERLSTSGSPALFRAMTAVMLLGPSTPMLFQGEEFGSTRPFLYFADHRPPLASLVEAGRRQFLAQFPSTVSDAAQALIASPSDEETFSSCKLDWSERDRHPEMLALHRDLIRLRREDPAFASGRRDRLHGAVLGDQALVLRFFCPDGDRVLVVNLGRDLVLPSVPEPLLAPPLGRRWRTKWSSEDPGYGGDGVSPVETDDGFRFPGRAAVVLEPGETTWPEPEVLA